MNYRAARHHADRTNQKLYFCRINYQALQTDLPLQLQQVHKEQAVFHLYGAYLALLQEISHTLGLSLREFSLANIEQALKDKTQVSPEISQLKILAEQGLIKQIITTYQQCLYLPNSDKQPLLLTADAAKTNAIHVINMATLSETWLPTLETLKKWCEEFEVLIEQFRGSMQEY